MRRYRVLRPTDDSSYIMVDLEFDSSSGAEDYLAEARELWPRLGAEGLIRSPQQARLVEAVEIKQY